MLQPFLVVLLILFHLIVALLLEAIKHDSKSRLPRFSPQNLRNFVSLFCCFRPFRPRLRGLFCCCFILPNFLLLFCCVFLFYFFAPTQQKKKKRELKKPSSRFFPPVVKSSDTQAGVSSTTLGLNFYPSRYWSVHEKNWKTALRVFSGGGNTKESASETSHVMVQMLHIEGVQFTCEHV